MNDTRKTLADEPTALEQYKAVGDAEPDTPLERLRFFCSLAMRGQDWLDAEPFFEALAQPKPAPFTEGALMGVYMQFDRHANKAWTAPEYLLHFAEAVQQAVLAAPTPAQPEPEPVEGEQLVYVRGFDELLQALERADRKGYMPDAMADEWAAFDYRVAALPPARPPTAAESAALQDAAEGGLRDRPALSDALISRLANCRAMATDRGVPPIDVQSIDEAIRALKGTP
jgi:hypothetical protein